MTSVPTTSGNDPLLRELIASVQDLDTHVQENAAQMEKLAEGEERLERSRRRHRLWIALTMVGLVLDLALSGLFLYQHQIQSCTNKQLRDRATYSQRSFEAERSKVIGQVEGLRELRSAGNDRVKALAGFDRFITASERYLDEIAVIHDDQVKHPLGTC